MRLNVYLHWLRLQTRKMALSRLQVLFYGLILFVALVILSNVMHLKELHKEQIKLSSTKLQSFDNPGILKSVKKPLYYLCAQSADTPHMLHIRNVFQRLGFERWHEGTGLGWDVMWAYDYPFSNSIKKPNDITQHQVINHFPGSGFLTSKVYLARSKSKHIPTAFSLPKEKDTFIKFAKLNPSKLWVQKNNQHRGITIRSMEEIDLAASDSFIQEFVNDPFLVDGRKFDIGIYTVITSVDPLRVYVYDGEWLLRYCPEDYHPFNARNTNKYVVADDYTPTWEMPSLKDSYQRLKMSHKTSLLEFVRKQNLDPNKLQADIYTAISDTVKLKQADIASAVLKYPFGTDSFFEMVRFDFVLDSKLKVYLMEVNMSPNLSSAHFTDNAFMYEKVVFNTLSLAGVATMTSRIGNHYLGEGEGMVCSDRDIQVYDSECQKCKDCKTELCQLCAPCWSEVVKGFLTASYLEHVNKMRSKRVYPPPLVTQNFAKLELQNLPHKDRLLANWFAGMCRKNVDWCS